MKKIYIFFLLIFLTINPFLKSLTQTKTDTLLIAFWNLQNFFDTIDDPDKIDEEFTPSSEMEWTKERLDKKLYNLSRVINLMNDEKGPDILGVCEVEHQYLLDTLASKYLVNKYKIAYYESPDNRGIDNGLIYNSEKFNLLSIIPDTIKLPDNYPTRLILNVNLLTKTDDTLYVFVNHWPSRRGGDVTIESRKIAAETLRNSVKNYYKNGFAKIIILGDFNDEPTDESILTSLKAHPIVCDSIVFGDELIFDDTKLLNLSYEAYAKGEGTYKHKEEWNMLDQIIISKDIFEDENFSYICNSFQVFKPEILLTKSGFYKGTPFPTYAGKKYLGGYSDHFPVTAKIILLRK